MLQQCSWLPSITQQTTNLFSFLDVHGLFFSPSFPIMWTPIQENIPIYHLSLRVCSNYTNYQASFLQMGGRCCPWSFQRPLQRKVLLSVWRSRCLLIPRWEKWITFFLSEIFFQAANDTRQTSTNWLYTGLSSALRAAPSSLKRKPEIQISAMKLVLSWGGCCGFTNIISQEHSNITLCVVLLLFSNKSQIWRD